MNQIEKKSLDPHVIRGDFKILYQTIHKNRPLVYLDSAASSQRPHSVIQAMSDFYEHSYANVHRGIHWLSEQSSEQYEAVREKVATFVNARYANEIIFTSGTTAAINLVAHSWGSQNVRADDEILLTIMEHHSNIVPWQQLSERTGCLVRFAGMTRQGYLDLEDFARQLKSTTKVVAITAISNVLGTINPIQEICRIAHEAGAIVVVDAAQHVPHEPTDVQAWDADFVVFSGHKMLGPSGIGVLYGKQELLDRMPPFLGGGNMISLVTTSGYEVGELPAKFEAGTPPIAETIGLGAAIDYLHKFDLLAIAGHEAELTHRAHQVLTEIPGLTILGPDSDDKAGIVSYVVDGLSSQDMAIMLDRQGVAIRAGHHCAMPLHEYLGISNSCRASFYLYNTIEEVERLGEAMEKSIAKLR